MIDLENFELDEYEEMYSTDYMPIFRSVPSEISTPILAFVNSVLGANLSVNARIAVTQTLFYLCHKENTSVGLADKFNSIRFEIREINGIDLISFPRNLIDEIVAVLGKSFGLNEEEALQVLNSVNDYFKTKEVTEPNTTPEFVEG